MNNTEKKINFIFETMRHNLELTINTENYDTIRESLKLLNEADRIIADEETEKEETEVYDKTNEILGNNHPEVNKDVSYTSDETEDKA